MQEPQEETTIVSAPMWEALKELVKEAEGFRPFAYFDVKQYSGGFGHKLSSDWNTATRITLQQADTWLEQDLQDSLNECRSQGLFSHMNQIRVITLIELCFNIGLPSLLKFRKMIAAIERQDWSKAAWEMLDSKWAKQVKGRAIRMAGQMRDGELQLTSGIGGLRRNWKVTT